MTGEGPFRARARARARARSFSILPVLALALSSPVFSQDEKKTDAKAFREALAKEGPRKALEGEARLAAHLGLARAGSLYLRTKIVEKNGEKLYEIEDRLVFDAPGIGEVRMTALGFLAADLSVRELSLETSAPGKDGVVARRLLTVAPEGGALFVTDQKDDSKATRRKLEGTDAATLILTPPLGAGERLARLALGNGARLSCDAFEIAKGESGKLVVSPGGEATIDVRGAALAARAVSRDEDGVKLEAWIVPATLEVLKVVRADGEKRVVFFGREPETAQDLAPPAVPSRKDEGPAATVLRFLRATTRGKPGEKADAATAVEIAGLLDADALYARSKGDPAEKGLRARFEKVLVEKLTGEEWRRSGAVKLLSLAARPEDLVEETTGERAKVKPKGGETTFELVKTGDGWKIAAFPE